MPTLMKIDNRMIILIYLTKFEYAKETKMYKTKNNMIKLLKRIKKGSIMRQHHVYSILIYENENKK
jgi:hypothetical protein